MRGTRVDGSLTIIQVDARLAEVKDAGLSRLIEKFNTMDHNKSGDIDSAEFCALARQLIPSCSDEFLEQMFKDVDKDGNGMISFTEYCSYCMPRLRGAEAAEKERMEREDVESRERELQQIRDFTAAQVQDECSRRMAKQTKAFYKQLRYKQQMLDEVILQRKAAATMAAQTLMTTNELNDPADRTRTRKLSKLTKAIESGTLSSTSLRPADEALFAKVWTDKRRARTPTYVSGRSVTPSSSLRAPSPRPTAPPIKAAAQNGSGDVSGRSATHSSSHRAPSPRPAAPETKAAAHNESGASSAKQSSSKVNSKPPLRPHGPVRGPSLLNALGDSSFGR